MMALQENFFGAFRAGLRYTRASALCMSCCCAPRSSSPLPALSGLCFRLLPVSFLGGDASFYGILLGAVGAGAIGGAIVMPKLRERLSADGLLLGAAIITATVMGASRSLTPKFVAIIVLLFLGAAWITALTTLNGAAQAVLPIGYEAAVLPSTSPSSTGR